MSPSSYKILVNRYVEINSKHCELAFHEPISQSEHWVRKEMVGNIMKHSWNHVHGNKSVSKLLPDRFQEY